MKHRNVTELNVPFNFIMQYNLTKWQLCISMYLCMIWRDLLCHHSFPSWCVSWYKNRLVIFYTFDGFILKWIQCKLIGSSRVWGEWAEGYLHMVRREGNLMCTRWRAVNTVHLDTSLKILRAKSIYERIKHSTIS